MPHVTIKCYPGRSEEQKKLLAQKIAGDIVECFGAAEGSISIDIQEVPQEQWQPELSAVLYLMSHLQE
jgi:4-oxalocrotonate tautomerase